MHPELYITCSLVCGLSNASDNLQRIVINKKSLLVSCDETGMDSLLGDPNNAPHDGSSPQAPTNVNRLSRAIPSSRVVGNIVIPQITFYQSGTENLTSSFND
ncbi:unnamed protein product [Somion occarium]|uniref:Uncharacterized protein n=1 Tax=Somion occarium TaxID=3059160 RepID=A0ABP1DI65_9APHY